MSIQIKLKNSVVQDSTPSTSDLPVVGELALNANINSIGGFMRASDNTIVKIFGPGSLSTPTATTTVSGISELATNSETTTGTATNRVVTPAGLNAVTVAERTTSNTNYVAKAGSTMTGVLQVTAGSASAPAINFGASNTGIYQASGGNNVRIAVDGSDAISASTAGGINFSLKATALTSLTLGSQSATDKPLFFADAGSVESASLLLDNSSNEFRVRNNRFSGKIVFAPSQNVEKARIDNAGRLLVGQSASVNVGSTTAGFLQIASSTGTINSSFAAYGNNNSPCMIAIGRSRSGTVGTAGTALQDDDVIGLIRFAGDDGTDLQSQAASIAVEVDGTPGSNDMPGRLVFGTTADGAASPTANLVINNTGQVGIGIGNSAPKNNNKLHVRMADSSIATPSNQSVLLVENNTNAWITIGSGASSYGGILFGDSGAAGIGQVRYNHNGNNLEFHTNSSERMRIDSDGDLLVGLTTALSTQAGSIQAAGPIIAKSFINEHTSSAIVIDHHSNVSRIRTYGATSGTGQLAFNVGGGGDATDSEAMRIDSSGKVGIGTQSPDFPLDTVFTNANSSSFSTSLAMGSGANGDLYALHLQNLGTGNCESGLLFSAGNTQFGQWSLNCVKTGAFVGDLAFRTRTGSATSAERMRIDSSGRVGIGCIPTAQFNHNLIQIGNQATLGANAALSTTGQTFLTHNLYFDPSGNYQVFNTSSANEGTILRMVDGNFTFSNSAATTGTPTVTERMRIDASGRLLLGTTTEGHVNADNLTVAGSGDTGITIRSGTSDAGSLFFSDATSGNAEFAGFLQYLHNQNSLNFGTDETTRMTINNSGSVGIGTTSPETLLHARVNTFSDDINKVALTLSNNQSSGVHQYFQNASTGSGVSNGARIGLGNTDNFLIQQFEAKDIQISTNGTERMRITADGPHLLLGGTSDVNEITESSANAGMVIGGTGFGNAGLAIITSTSGTGRLYFGDAVANAAGRNRGQINYGHSDDHMRFVTASSERMRIDSSGQVGIGTSSPAALKLHLYDATNTSSSREQFRISGGDRTSDSFETGIRFHTVSPSANGNRHYRLTANGNIGLTIQGHETSTGNAAADRAVLLNPSGGTVRFGASAAIQSERFTFFRQESDANTLAYFHQAASANVSGIIMRHGRGLSGFSGKMISFCRNDGTEVGSVTVGASSTAFNTSSDYRLKENVTPISDGITRLKTLKPYRFNFKDDTTKPVVDGFFAHEVTAVPEAITGTKDEVDADNNPVYQSIDQSKLVPLLVAAVQELIGRVEKLEAA